MSNKHHTVYVGVGSNIGDRIAAIRSAGALIENHSRITVLRSSDIYETQPYGYKDQDFFLNCVFELETDLPPDTLLSVLLGIEKMLKRERFIHWGPRTIDLDILFFDDLVLQTPALTIPHRELHKRLFVLTPLADLIPRYVHPLLGKSCLEMEKSISAGERLSVDFYTEGIDFHKRK